MGDQICALIPFSFQPTLAARAFHSPRGSAGPPPSRAPHAAAPAPPGGRSRRAPLFPAKQNVDQDQKVIFTLKISVLKRTEN